jgi:flagellar hook-associated protein 1 FlgK
MASTFTGLSIANRGLASSQAGLAVTTNNISNVNTSGYSRQTATQVSVGPAAVYSSRGAVGGGSEVTSVDRIRSFRLDQKYWQENSALGSWETKAGYLEELQEVLGTSSSDDVFNTTMDEFYSALETLSGDPTSEAARTVVRETGQAVCAYLNNAATQLSELRQDINTEINTAVDQINSYARQIAALNHRIGVATSNGAAANELCDERDLLIDKLSALTDVTVTETKTGQAADGTEITAYTVAINGIALVSGDNARQLECYTVSGGTADGLYGIRWADSGDAFEPAKNGALQAYLDLRDGSGTNGEYKGIVYFAAQLDTFASTFAKAFNEGIYRDGSSYYGGHAAGYGTDDTTGIRFFSYDGLSSTDLMASGATTDAVYANITAANISLSSDIEDDLAKIAASSASGEEGNNGNSDDLLSICRDSRLFASGSPEDFYNSIIATLGTTAAYASQQSDVQSNLVAYLDDSRSSVAGVSTNEETAYMTKYQQAYEASASMVTTWNEIYQTTIDMVSD